MITRGRIAVLALAPLASLALALPEKTIRWEPVGLSGGGALFAPAISPADSKRILVECDMSAAYVSLDGATSWRMIHRSQLRSSTRCRGAWHPTDPKIVIAANGDDGLAISRDSGEKWSALGKLGRPARGEVAIDPALPDHVLAGVDDGAFGSSDGGATWSRCEGIDGEAIAFHFDATSAFAATKHGVWRSDDGSTWTKKTSGLPDAPVRAFAGGSNAKAKVVLLYCAVPCEAKDGALSGGIYRSRDRGESWERVMNDGLNLETKAFDQWAHGPVVQYHHLLTSDARPATVFAFNSNTGVPPPHHASAYRSDDAGKTWRPTFQADPRFPGLNVERDYTVQNVRQFYQSIPNGVAGSPRDPDVVATVDDGRLYLTTDGGRSWRCGHTRAAGDAWACDGLVVTSTWNHYVDPFDPALHFICYTDIGFARSHDKGHTWEWWKLEGRSPWANTCYELAFDPAVRGKVWGAFSDVHDIPNDNVISGRHRSDGPGGVCASLDSGATWKPCDLPKLPVTSIALDPRSKPGARTLYAGTFGKGVLRSTDDGASWTDFSQGLATENRRVVRVVVHADGTVFALVTALRKGDRFEPAGTGVWRAKGARWERISQDGELLWPKDMTVDPQDSRVVWVGAADAREKKQGGLWRTVDGGATWERVLRQGPQHFGAYLHPKKKGWVWATLCEDAPGAALWLSQDGGKTWAPQEALPFGNVQRVTVDPANANAIFVTTFGGSVWHGPASE